MDYQTFQPGGQGQDQTPVVPPLMESMPRKTFTPRFIGVILILIVFGAGAFYAIWWWGNQQHPEINSFQDCVIAGYPVMESYPRRCNTPDGKHFVEDVDQTKDWQTYRNDTYGFEFKYPSSWAKVIRLPASSIDYLSGNGTRFFVAIYPDIYPAQDFSARIDIYQAASMETVIFDNKFLSNARSSRVMVNGITWTKIDSNYLIQTNAEDPYVSNIFHISGPDDIVDPILSTFKFINLNQGQKVCASDAKQCPDGSYVGRTGLNCEFVCPE